MWSVGSIWIGVWAGFGDVGGKGCTDYKGGRAYAEKLEESGWDGRVEVVETEDEDHVFHIRDPDSDNARLLVQRFAEFLRHVCNK
ncbi:unnamed protein product [Eruca vesicaria subsp. sativa]|uniref:Alpha/beta hydrolase fold-3 domain-containing protein n=1 Tax=Eruca vesicaria subsp. sativa TaxID=29727 RepID=A0ABC8KFM8_ERUVS|nr:unnamed protein product [Eruca vesicaria subsp. sativa]